MAKHILFLQAYADKNKLSEDISIFAAAYAFDYEKYYLDVPVFFNEGESRISIEQTLNGIYQSIDSWPSEWMRLYAISAPFDNLHLPAILDFIKTANIDISQSQYEAVSIKYNKARKENLLNNIDAAFIVSETNNWKDFDNAGISNDLNFKNKVFHCMYDGLNFNKFAALVDGNIDILYNKLSTSEQLSVVFPSLYKVKKQIFDFSPELFMIITLAMNEDGEYSVEEIPIDTRKDNS